MGRRSNSVKASVGALFALLISVGIFALLLYSQTDTIEETVDAGFDGIRKAEEVKRELEMRPQEQP